MSFFNRKQKKLALTCSSEKLEKSYKKSEHDLRCASTLGNDRLLKQEMKKHKDYEYAILYQNTPQFRKKYKNFEELKQGSAVNFSKDRQGNIRAQNVSVVDFNNPVGKVAYGIWGQDEKTVDYYQKNPNKKVRPYKK